ncbi:MAG TPA: BON domain-containing protein [Thermomicrobiales bacterium]|nr:BON domain-containing protein [Thermomicrobiales bacterium]
MADNDRPHAMPLLGHRFGNGGFGYGYYGPGVRRANHGGNVDIPDDGVGYGYSGYGRGFTYTGYGPDYYDYHPSGVRSDREQTPNYAGVGPRAYRRAAELILDDLNDRLTVDPWLDAENIETSVDNGVVTLTGSVASRADKRLAEDLADDVPGVIDVDNRLRIEPGAPEHWAGPARSRFGSTVVPGTGE